jgi:hypothetical protein
VLCATSQVVRIEVIDDEYRRGYNGTVEKGGVSMRPLSGRRSFLIW